MTTQTQLEPAGARISKLRAQLLLEPSRAFWGALGLELALDCDPACETMATDGRRLIYGPAFVATLPDAELLGVIVHEIAHCSALHHTRRGGRDPEQWNIAADYAVNDWILAAGFKLPPDVLIDPAFAGMGAEQIYAIRDAERRQREQKQKAAGNAPQNAPAGAGAGAPQSAPGNPGNAPAPAGAAPQSPGNASGQGAPGAPAPGNAPGGNAPGAGAPDVRAPAWGKVMDAAPEHDAAGRAEADAQWQAKVRAAVAVAARAAGAGKLPAALRRLVGELDAPRHNWRERLRQYADNGSRRENSWRRPSRRYAASGLYLPASISANPCRLVFVIDSSGSMFAPGITELMSEGAAMLESGAVDVLNVLCVNTRVQQSAEFTAANAAELVEFMPEPSGGTRFAPAFDWIAENAADAAAIVYATDLDCSDYGPEPLQPVLWLATPTRRPMPAPPFGAVIPLDVNA